MSEERPATLEATEWLEADGLGGYSMGTAAGRRTRRYHGLLCAATTPPTGRMLLVNGFEVRVASPAGTTYLSTHRYEGGAGDVIHPNGDRWISSFDVDPWPTRRYELPDGVEIFEEIFAVKGSPATCLSFRTGKRSSSLQLFLRPLLSGRDHHALHHENAAFAFVPQRRGESLLWRPYPGVPGISILSNGAYEHDPQWYRRFLYSAERERGLDCVEDLASPGTLRFDLGDGPAVLVLSAQGIPGTTSPPEGRASEVHRRLRKRERRRRRRFPTLLSRAADAYVVRRGDGSTIVAGYPWFTDWGRDTFVSIRGLCLATGRISTAVEILRRWGREVRDGMLPNRFVESGDEPDYDSVDASLWFVLSASELLSAVEAGRARVGEKARREIEAAVQSILRGLVSGGRRGIRVDDDGLLACGEPGTQLTWMDAQVEGRPVTGRVGKPVEVQALWIQALTLGGERWTGPRDRALAAFRDRFWNEDRGCLYDVVDVDHVKGSVDDSLRPNQIFASGGLPYCPLEPERARSVVEVVEKELVTPFGLRTLARSAAGYRPRYEGDPSERDGAYHQGTAWPWLLGPFADAWARAHGKTAKAAKEAEERFLSPILEHARTRGGHVFEIADGDLPQRARGCPFQAWSVGELARKKSDSRQSTVDSSPA